MNNGFRFKKRLPAYISKISDINDTLIAEDKEFDRIEALLNDFTSSFTIDSIRYVSNPNFYLSKYENDYNLSHIGSIEERINRIKFKMFGTRTTTEKLILEICDLFKAPGTLNQRYNEYAFTLDLHISKSINLIELERMLRDIIPAHLDFDIRVFLIEKLIYREETNSYLNRFYITGNNLYKTGQIFKPIYSGRKVVETINVKNGGTNKTARHTKSGERKSSK